MTYTMSVRHANVVRHSKDMCRESELGLEIAFTELEERTWWAATGSNRRPLACQLVAGSELADSPFWYSRAAILCRKVALRERNLVPLVPLKGASQFRRSPFRVQGQRLWYEVAPTQRYLVSPQTTVRRPPSPMIALLAALVACRVPFFRLPTAMPCSAATAISGSAGPRRCRAAWCRLRRARLPTAV